MTRRMHRRDVTARLLTASVLLVMLVSFVGLGYASPGGSYEVESSESTGTVPGGGSRDRSDDDREGGRQGRNEAEVPPAEEPPTEAPVDEEPPAEEPPAEEPAATVPAPDKTPEPDVKAPATVSTSVDADSTVGSVATSQGVVPILVEGNPECEDHEWSKIDRTPTDGVYTTFDEQSSPLPPNSSIEVLDSDGYTFGFKATGVVIHGVIVKASSAANVYKYVPAVTWDNGLYTVEDHQISHVTFCWEPAPPGQAHILVRKYHDYSGEGTREGGEPWMEGFTFTLEKADGGENDVPDGSTAWTYVDTKTTLGADGKADFGMQPFGWYRITELPIADWTPTSPAVKVFYHTGEVNGQGTYDAEEHWFGNQQIIEKTFKLSYEGAQPANTAFFVTYFLDGVEQPPLSLAGTDPFIATVPVAY